MGSRWGCTLYSTSFGCMPRAQPPFPTRIRGGQMRLASFGRVHPACDSFFRQHRFVKVSEVPSSDTLSLWNGTRFAIPRSQIRFHNPSGSHTGICQKQTGVSYSLLFVVRLVF